MYGNLSVLKWSARHAKLPANHDSDVSLYRLAIR